MSAPAKVTPTAFAASVLQKLGIHQTPGAVRALVGWSAAEGGNWHNDAKYNPLNTTQVMPGAGNTGTQGDIKVYKNWDQGIDATVKTLKYPAYKGILSALASGNATSVADAIGKTPWGTNGALVRSAIAGTPQTPGAKPIAGSTPTTSKPKLPDLSAITIDSPASGAFDAAGFEKARRRSVVAAMLMQHDPQSMLLRTGVLSATPPNPADFATAAPAATSDASTPPDVPSAAAAKPTAKTSAGGHVIVAPGANRAGAKLQQPLLTYLREVSAASGRPTEITTGTNHNQYVAGEPGVESEHWTGYGADEAVGGDARTDKAAAKKGDLIAAHSIQVAAGIPFSKALAMAQKGGVFNFDTKAGRVQIIWRSMVGGDHFNHVHRGINPS